MQQLLFSNLIRLPVASLSQQKKLGSIFQVIVELKDMEVKGFLIRKNFFSPVQYLSYDEVVDIEREGLMIRGEEVLSSPQEIVRVADILRQKINLIGLPIRTKSGKYLGRIFDFVFDSITAKIQSFYTARLFDRRIIARSKIIQADRRVMIVEDDVKMVGAAEAM
jgi:uncharacterized protein YrrD